MKASKHRGKYKVIRKLWKEVGAQRRFGTFLKNSRVEANISVNELAIELDVPRKEIRRWEKGYILPPNRPLLKMINIFGHDTAIEVLKIQFAVREEMEQLLKDRIAL